MSKDVTVNGKNFEGVSTVQLPLTNGGSALFRDVDEISNVDGIVAMACGTFSVESETDGKVNSNYTLVFEHGMGMTPDVWCATPQYWYNTQNSQLRVVTYNAKTGMSAVCGTRDVEAGTNWNGVSTEKLADETTITLYGGAFAKFFPTYIDNDGNEGKQIYHWVAVKFAE